MPEKQKISYPNIRKFKIALAAIIAVLFLPSSIVASGEKGGIEKYIFKEAGKILENGGWKVISQNSRILACKFENSYNELTLDIHTDPGPEYYTIDVSITVNGKTESRDFIIKKGMLKDMSLIRELVMPFVIQHSLSDPLPVSKKKAYSVSLSAGYNRTHDNIKFYPEKREGSFYTAASLLYDPARHAEAGELNLDMGEYMFLDFYFAYDSKMRENFFNIDILLHGKNRFGRDGASSKRTLYGYFNGFEYFRPGFYNSILTWNSKLYKKQPHIQYTLWRALQWGLINTFKNGPEYTFKLMIGFGPSINSSLTAVHVEKEEEKALSHIFKSIKYRKQNYYYSVCWPVSSSFLIDKIFDFRIGAGYNFYIFYPVENEVAYDIVNILKFSTGYYVTDLILINARYEYWNIQARVKSTRDSHYWNRLVLELKILF